MPLGRPMCRPCICGAALRNCKDDSPSAPPRARLRPDRSPGRGAARAAPGGKDHARARNRQGARRSVYLDLESDADRAKLSDPERYLSHHADTVSMAPILAREEDTYSRAPPTWLSALRARPKSRILRGRACSLRGRASSRLRSPLPAADFSNNLARLASSLPPERALRPCPVPFATTSTS